MSTDLQNTVLFEKRGAVALVTMNRPQALNSFTRQMHNDLWSAFDQAEADSEIRAMVLTGAGRAFVLVPICLNLISHRGLIKSNGRTQAPSLSKRLTPPHAGCKVCACPVLRL